jgi:hypothetical protein
VNNINKCSSLNNQYFKFRGGEETLHCFMNKVNGSVIVCVHIRLEAWNLSIKWHERWLRSQWNLESGFMSYVPKRNHSKIITKRFKRKRQLFRRSHHTEGEKGGKAGQAINVKKCPLT